MQKTAKLNRSRTLLVGIGLALFLGVFSSGGPTAQAAVPTIMNLNLTLQGDGASSAYLNWHTPRTSSSSVAQPNMGLVYAKTSDPLVVNSTTTIQAARTVTDRVAYFKVSLTGLDPDTRYHYQLVNTDTLEASSAYYFTTGPAAEADSFTFLSVPDAHYRTTSSYTNHWGNTLNAALIEYPEAAFAVHTGEFVSSTSLERWDGFFGLASNVLSTLPLVAAPGAGSSTNRYYIDNFNVVATGQEGADFSFTYGNALFLVLNTAQNSSAEIAVHESFIATQARANPGKWIIAVIADSFYGATSNSSTIKTRLSAAFKTAGVALVIQGGDAMYTRSYLIDGSTVHSEYPSESVLATSDGIVYLTPGTGGAEYPSGPAASATWLQRSVNYYSTSAWRTDAAHKTYAGITVSADAITVNARNVAGSVIDSFEINRGARPAPDERKLEFSGLNNTFGTAALVVRNASAIAGTSAKTSRTLNWMTSDVTLGRPHVQIVEPTSNARYTYYGSAAAETAFFTGSNARNVNTVKLGGLTPGTTYQYRIGNIYHSTALAMDIFYYSDWYTFTTEDYVTESFTAIHFADSQSSSTDRYASYWTPTLETALANHPDTALILHTGDIVDGDSRSQWSAWWDATGDNLASAAYLPMAGNHEDYSNSRTFMSSVFAVPDELGYQLNAAYLYGNALFITLNSNYDTQAQLQAQGQWVVDLAAEARKLRGNDIFVLVGFHKAPYGGTHRTDSDVVRIKNYLVPYLEQAKVDLVLQGHDHNYIRSYPVQNGVPQTTKGGSVLDTATNGPVFLVSQNSGGKFYTAASSQPTIYDVHINPNSYQNNAAYTVYTVLEFSAGQLKVSAYYSSGGLLDQFTIVR